MTTLSIKIEDKLAQWLQAHSARAGQSPDEIIRDALSRLQKLDEIQAVATRMHQRTLAAGLTSEEEIIQEALAERNARRSY